MSFKTKNSFNGVNVSKTVLFKYYIENRYVKNFKVKKKCICLL